MAKDRVFELIRSEEVVLFIGAGMSLYAGCPSGAMLSEILYNNLTNELKGQIEFTNDLPKLADEIYNIKGGNKNYLFSTLKKEFQKPYISTEIHELLAKIPHFKNIITTNYDTLIESTNANIEVIRKSADYVIANPKKTFLFKIHSDLSCTENLILTTSDYNNYFSTSSEITVFWNAIKDRLASNHILFIGYALEDSNIIVLLDKIIKELGDTRKEIFFVSPSIKPSKLKYLQTKNIEYIESSGEKLINDIFEDLKSNYYPNLSKGLGTADTAMSFANVNQMAVTLNKKDEKLEIGDIKSLDENNHHKIEVEFEFPTNEQKNRVIASINGKDFEDVCIDKDSLKRFNLFFKDFRFKTENDINKLIIKKLPVFDFNMDLIFEDGFEIDNYPFKLFAISPSKNESHLKIEVEDFTIITKIEFETNKNITKYNIEVFPSDQIKSTNSGIKFYQILHRIISNQKIKIYKENKIFYNYIPKINFSDEALNAKLLLQYFYDLKKIENHFDIRFTKISLNKIFEKPIKKIISYIDKKSFSEHFGGHTFKIDDQEEFQNFIKSGEEERVLIMSENERSIIELYDNKFDLGYLHSIIYNLSIENLQDLKSNKTSEINLKSKDDLIYLQYSDKKTLILNYP